MQSNSVQTFTSIVLIFTMGTLFVGYKDLLFIVLSIKTPEYEIYNYNLEQGQPSKNVL